MRRLDRYILAEVAAPFIVGVVLVQVILLGDQLHKMLRILITQDVGLGVIVQLLLFILPELAVTGIPLATILAVSVGVNRLASDSEWSTMRLAGVSFARMLVPLHVFGLGVALLTWTIGEHLAPAAKTEFQRVFDSLRFSNPALVIEPERWLETPSGDARFFVSRVDRRTRRLGNLLILTDLQNDYPTALCAREAYFDDEGFVMLDVVRHVWRPDGTLRADSRTAQARIEVRRFTFSGMASSVLQSEASSDLRRRIAEARAKNLQALDAVIQLHMNYAAPVGCYLLALMCAPLALLTARRGAFAGFLIAAVLVIVYFLSLQFGKSLAASQSFEALPALGVWLQNLAFGLVAALLCLRARRH